MNAIKAGGAYFGAVFAIGFALGFVRVFLLEPALGPFFAVLIELPFMLTASWLISGWVIRRFRVPSKIEPRLFMGVIAFALLMAAEFSLARFAFGQSAAQQWQALGAASGALGFAGQMIFAFIPLLRLFSGRKT